MKGGLRRLVHPGTPAHLVDIEGTRDRRRRINQAIRERQRVLAALEAEPIPAVPDSTKQLP